MPPSKGPFSANIHPMIPKLSVPIPEGMGIRKMVRALFENAGVGFKNHLKSPLAPQPVPLKLDSMPLSKGPFSANIHPMIPKLFVPIPEGMCIRTNVGTPFENAGVGVKNPPEITLSTPQPVPLKLDSMPLSKGPFSANIHPIIPKLSVPIPEGMCIRKMVEATFENAAIEVKNPPEITLSTPAGTAETWFNATF